MEILTRYRCPLCLTLSVFPIWILISDGVWFSGIEFNLCLTNKLVYKKVQRNEKFFVFYLVFFARVWFLVAFLY